MAVKTTEPLDEKIELAFVYGSVAKGTDRAGSDLDLLIVGDDIGYPEVYEALEAAERTLARTVNPTILTRDEWRTKRAEADSFVRRIATQPRLLVIAEAES